MTATVATESGPRVMSDAKRDGLWLGGAVLLIVLYKISDQPVAAEQLVLAGALLFFSIHAYLSWTRTRDTTIPVWPLLCGIHFVYFGVAIFFSSRVSPSRFDGGALLQESTLTAAMLVGFLGLLSMACGRKVARICAGSSRLHLRFVNVGIYTPVRIQIFLFLGIAANIFGLPFFGTGLWNVSGVFFGIIPLASFLWIFLAGNVRNIQKMDILLAGVFFVSRLLAGSKSGASLGTIVGVLLVAGLAAASAGRRLPWPVIGIALGLVLFLQPSKISVRHEMARQAPGESVSPLHWVQVAALGWEDVIAGRTTLGSQFEPSSSRLSLLTMTGVILNKTPDIVPFQLGANYHLLLENIIPRVFWADKPSMNVANQFFQIEYGLTTPGNLRGVSIASGFEAEGYMNFGWAGVFIEAFLMGFAYGYYEHLFFSPGCSLAATAVGLALFQGFLTIESQMVQYLGGILQAFFASYVVFADSKPRDSQLRRPQTQHFAAIGR